MIAWLKRLLSREPTLTLGRNGPRLDPHMRYAFTAVTNFATEQEAERCILGLQHLRLAHEVKGLANGRWNASFTFTMLADPRKVGDRYESIKDAAARHGGSLGMFMVGRAPEAA